MDHLPEHIGRYQILGLLGTGGMAEVLLARLHGPSGFERPVVIKRILPHLARERRFRDMFLDEARIVAGIRHQNVVQVQELGQEGDQLYLVMEYLEGESASSLARRLAAHQKLLSFGLSAYLMAEVAAGLHAAHELRDHDGVSQGLVHRDVSPANVFLTYAGEVKMIDFGIAVAADRRSRTEAGQVKGKYAYMSPEQCQGLTLDRRSDIFSMGTVLYELSTCRRLFKRSSDMVTLQAICHEEVRPPTEFVPEYPPELERICLRALSKNPDERYPTALEMRRDLLHVAQALNGRKVPEESMAKVMHRLFPDRIEEKRRMLTKLKAGEELTRVPVAEPDDGVEPAVVGDRDPARGARHPSLLLRGASVLSDTGSGPRSDETDKHEGSISVAVVPPPLLARPTRWLIGAAVLVGLLGGRLVLDAAREGPPRASTGPALSTLAPPSRVEMVVVSDPPGAEVRFDGTPRGTTPVRFEVPRSTTAASLRLALAGHQVVDDEVVPDRDQRLRVVLVETPVGAKRAESSAGAPGGAVPAPGAMDPGDRSRRSKERGKEPESPYSRFN